MSDGGKKVTVTAKSDSHLFPVYERRLIAVLVFLAVLLSTVNLYFYFQHRVELRLADAVRKADHP